MRGLVRGVLGVAVVGSVVVSAAAAVGAEHAFPAAVAAVGVLPSTALALLVVLAIGRLGIEWLPAGHLGQFGPGLRGPTLAASGLVGALLIGLSGWIGNGPAPVMLAAAALVAALPAVARALLGPGPMVPRHPAPAERAGTVARATGVALVAACLGVGALAIAVSGAARGIEVERAVWLSGATLLAATALLEWGLATARRAPFERRVWLLAWVALGPGSDTPPGVLVAAGFAGALAMAGVAAGGVAWLRRADRQALWFAVLAALLLAHVTSLGPAIVLPAAVALVACTPRPSRRRAAVAGAVALGLSAIAGWPATGEAFAATLPLTHAPIELRTQGLIAFAAVALAVLAVVRRRGAPAVEGAAPREPGRELAFALSLAAAALAPHLLLDARPSTDAIEAWRLALVVPWILAVGLLLPPERPGTTSP